MNRSRNNPLVDTSRVLVAGRIKVTEKHNTEGEFAMTAFTDTSTRTTQIKFVQRYPLFSFFTLAILITWLIVLPSLLFGLPFKIFQTVGAYGPLLSAVIVSAAMGGDELRSLFNRMTNFRF